MENLVVTAPKLFDNEIVRPWNGTQQNWRRRKWRRRSCSAEKLWTLLVHCNYNTAVKVCYTYYKRKMMCGLILKHRKILRCFKSWVQCFFNAGCNQQLFSLKSWKKIWCRSVLLFSKKMHTLIPKNDITEPKARLL